MISVSPIIETLLATHAPIAYGVSGGKDSCAMLFACEEYLAARGHQGPRLLIHSDLGRTEWKDSLPTCERLAKATGLELVVVRRAAGDMLARWLTRWENNVARYVGLECVKLILPWSTPGMRFCTSELKVDVICRELCRHFPGATIISASGIRADESTQRSKSPIHKVQPKLSSKTYNTQGVDWHPILSWCKEDVFGICERHGFVMHEAYSRYGSSRVSCCFCILGRESDLRAAAGCADNHEVYRQMVELEIASTFAFQGGKGKAAKWLGDVAPHLLCSEQRERLALAKQRAAQREEAESRIPKDLEYEKGWPTRLPVWSEAVLLAEVRQEVANAVGLQIQHSTPEAVLNRYAELLAAKALRDRRS